VSVEVKKHVLPKFRVDLEVDRAYYQPGQTVLGKLHAEYFFGKPVTGAAVEVEVRTADVAAKFHRKLNVRSDDRGDASFSFALPSALAGAPQHSGDAPISIQAVVTDAAGQKQTKTVSRTVSSRLLRVEVIPEGGSLIRGVSNTVYLYASYPDGTP